MNRTIVFMTASLLHYSFRDRLAGKRSERRPGLRSRQGAPGQQDEDAVIAIPFPQLPTNCQEPFPNAGGTIDLTAMMTSSVRRLLALLTTIALVTVAVGARSEPTVTLVLQHPEPVITTRTHGAEGNRFGFEGGRAVKVGGTYHLFTSEMIGNPMWVRMRLGYWTSTDCVHWTRAATIASRAPSSRVTITGRSLVTAAGLGRHQPPLEPVLRRISRDACRWDGLQLNMHGRIWRAVSRTPGEIWHCRSLRRCGRGAAAGSRLDAMGRTAGYGLVLPLACRKPLAGALWQRTVGTAADQALAGRTRGRPVAWGFLVAHTGAQSRTSRESLHRKPHRHARARRGWLAVYDTNTAEAIGGAWSADGEAWQPGHALVVQQTAANGRRTCAHRSA